MAISQDSASNIGSSQTGVSGLWNHTCATGAVLFVAIQSRAAVVSSVTYDGVNLTKAIGYNLNSANAEIWYLTNPTTGSSKTIQVTFSTTPTLWYANAVSLLGVNTSSPIGATAQYSDTLRIDYIEISVTPSYLNSWILDSVYSMTDWNMTANTFTELSSVIIAGNAVTDTACSSIGGPYSSQQTNRWNHDDLTGSHYQTIVAVEIREAVNQVVKIIDPNMGTGADYDSLYDWEAAQQGDLTGARDEIAVAKCRCTGGTADTTFVEIDGWTTSSTQYPKIWTDPAESYRHNGTYQTGNKYRLELSTGSGISIKESYTKVIGLQIYVSQDSNSIFGIICDGTYANEPLVSNCIIKGANRNRIQYGIYFYQLPWAPIAINNVVYDFSLSSSVGIYHTSSGSGGAGACYNNTIHNCYNGINLGSNSPICKNNLIKSCTTAIVGTAASGSGYNATDNASLNYTVTGGATGDRVSQTFTFVNESSDDFHLARTDAGAAGYGTDLSGTFIDDIDGNSRSGAIWSIGADQLSERVYVVDPDMGTGYDYDSLYDWEVARQATLVIPEVAKCRCTGGTADATAIVIDGWTVASDKYIKIWTDTAESYRHNGTYQTGNKYRVECDPAYEAGVIQIVEAYTKIIGLQIYVTGGGDDDYAFRIRAGGTIISHCIWKATKAGSWNVGAMTYVVAETGDSTVKFYNCSVYDWNQSGIRSYDGSLNHYVYNCTFHNCGVGITRDSGGMTVKNCLFKSCTSDISGTVTTSYCATNNSTGLSGTGDRLSQTFSFVDEAGDNFALKQNDIGALGRGTNLYNDSNIAFQDDIAAADRGGSGHFWSIGAFAGYEERVLVVDPNGGAGHDYDSLYDWEAARQEVLAVPETVKCRCTGGTADTTAVVIGGWTTASDKYIKIWTDPAESYRHSGTYPTGNKYRIEVTSPSPWAVIEMAEEYVRLIGLAVQATANDAGDYRNGILIGNSSLGNTTASACYVLNCIVKGVRSGGAANARGIVHEWCGTTTPTIAYVANNIVLDFNATGDSGLRNSSNGTANMTTYWYNNTVINCTDGITSPAGKSKALNNIIRSCTTGASGTFETGSGYNATDLSSMGYTVTGGAVGDRVSQTFSFVDEAGDNFALKQNDIGALGRGTNLYNNSNIAFQDDISSADRGGSGHVWSIGAFRGYEERVLVVDPDAGTGYDYDSLYDWEAARQEVLTVPETVKCRCTGGTADGADWLTVEGWTTAVDKPIKIWTDPAEGYRHNGTYQTGNKYRFEATTAGSWNRPFRILEDYVKVIGIQIKLNVSHDSCTALECDQASNITIEKCIIKGNVTGGTNLTLWGISAPVAGMKISNTIVYDFVSGTGTCKGMSVGITYGSASSWVYNCTVQNCRIGFQDYPGGGTVFKNCIAQDCYDGYADASGSSVNCVSDLASDVPGTNGRDSTTVTFVDKAGDDFHLASTDIGAKGYGTNLYNDANLAFQDDIDGNDRGAGTAEWDIGADHIDSGVIRLLKWQLMTSGTGGTITVPSDCTLLIVAYSDFYSSGYGHLTAASLGAASLTMGSQIQGSSGVNGMAGIWYLASPATGSQTLSLTFNDSAPIYSFILFYKGNDTSTPIRDSDTQIAPSDYSTLQTIESDAMDCAAGDVGLVVCFGYDSQTDAAPSGSSQMEISDWVDAAYYGMGLGKKEISNTGTTTMKISSVYPTIASVIIAKASVGGVTAGTTCWGHDTGVAEANTRDFSGNWTGTGTVENTGDNERIVLQAGQYMESEIVQLSGTVEIALNSYAGSGYAATVKYKTATTEGGIDGASWTTYSAAFTSSGYVKIRLEA